MTNMPNAKLKLTKTMKKIKSYELNNTFIGIITRNYTNKKWLLLFNCLHSFRTANKLKSHEVMYKIHDCCRVIMPEAQNKTL